MKLITRDTDYALRSLCYIAQNKNKVTSVSDLVKKLSIPRPFLRKILQILNKKGILKSQKGQGGGFLLAVAPNRIFLLDLIKILQGPFSLNECIFKKNLCPRRKDCALKRKLDSIEKYVVKELSSISLLYLLR